MSARIEASQGLDRLPGAVDVVVVGGGVIGLSVAFAVAERGKRVLVLDRGDVPGAATPAAGGMLAPVAESDVELDDLCAFRRYSHALYEDFIARVEKHAGLDCGFDTSGTLLVAVDRDHREELQRLQGIFADQGFPVEWLTPSEVLEREPSLSPRVVAGLDLVQDHCVDTRRLQAGLRAAIAALGGTVCTGAQVTHIEAHGAVTVQHQGVEHTVRGGHVVLAAGSWCNVDLQGTLTHMPMRPVKGQVLRLRAAHLLRRVVRTPDIYLIPHQAGHLIVGASVEEQGFDEVPTAGATFDLLRHAWRVLPGIYDEALDEICVGFRPAVRDHRPVLGQWQDSQVFAATGHYRNGILQAPGTAQLLADRLCDGTDHEYLQAFSPNRFEAAPHEWSTAGVAKGQGTTNARPAVFEENTP